MFKVSFVKLSERKVTKSILIQSVSEQIITDRKSNNGSLKQRTTMFGQIDSMFYRIDIEFLSSN